MIRGRWANLAKMPRSHLYLWHVVHNIGDRERFRQWIHMLSIGANEVWFHVVMQTAATCIV